MILSWLLGHEEIEVGCVLEIEHTAQSLHAHAIPEGVDIRPGDTVIVHGAPDHVPFGQTLTVACRATVVRANWLGRVVTRMSAIGGMTELYEVGFERSNAA